MEKNITISIVPEDIKADRTASGMLIDKLAMAIGEWEFDELMENNIDYEQEGANYCMEQYDYEARLLELMNKPRTLDALDKVLTALGMEREQIIAAWHGLKKYPRLKYGAAVALGDPKTFAGILHDFTEAVKDHADGYNDDDSYLTKFAPDLAKEMQDAIDGYWKYQRKEWLYGDYRDYAGILKLAARFFDAESVDYNKDNDSIGFEFTPEAAGELIENYYSDDDSGGKKIAALEVKSVLIDKITADMGYTADKKKAEREKRAEEWKKTKEYRDQQKAEEEAERVAKLKKMAR